MTPAKEYRDHIGVVTTAFAGVGALVDIATLVSFASEGKEIPFVNMGYAFLGLTLFGFGVGTATGLPEFIKNRRIISNRKQY